MEISEKDRQRFESKINKTEECWLWMGYLISGSYGRFMLKGKNTSAHRFSYMLSNGNIPDNLDVRHKCRYKNCVNPEHLELGTHTDNMRDRIRDGTTNRGNKSNTNKLTETQVREIRLSNKSQREIAKEYGITGANVWYIKHRISWYWLD